MTNRNISSRKPFLLKPCGKDYLWGGSRLNDDFSKEIPMMPLAETWECSTHPDGPSVVSGGDFDGCTLSDVLKGHPDFLGTHPAEGDDFPILIKLIDARNDLSIQVHPTDLYAREHENGQMGKTEMWYVLDAVKDAKVVYGLLRDMKREELRQCIIDGTVEKYLQKVPVKKDDIFFIEPGTIHAIGAGTLLAEIQENSNLTYRLYDYDRTDKNGEKRKLHIEKALDVADLKAAPDPRQPLRVLKYRHGCASEFLCRCRYFEVYRMLVDTKNLRSLVNYRADGASFRVLLCTDGCGLISFGERESILFFRGDCIFVPADSVELKIHGQACFLDIRG